MGVTVVVTGVPVVRGLISQQLRSPSCTPRRHTPDLLSASIGGLTADVQRGAYVDPRKSAETFGSVAAQWFATKGHRKPKTVAGYRSILDTLVLPKWGEVPLKQID